MKKYSFLFFALLASCHQEVEETKNEHAHIDSIISAVKQHNDSSEIVLHLADKKTMAVVNEVSVHLDSIHQVHAGLKSEYNQFKQSAVKTLMKVQRDTIYITEKKNFWGRTTRTVDSAGSYTEDTLVTKEFP